jgi:hypothetical protein
MGKEARLKAVEKPQDPKPGSEPVALPTLLDPSELAYQTTLLARIRREQAEHQALIKYWTDFLAAKYQLGPQDRIEENGRITRITAADASAAEKPGEKPSAEKSGEKPTTAHEKKPA